MKTNNKQVKKQEEFAVVLSKKQVRAVIRALRYDLDECGYTFVKDDLQLMLRIIIGDVSHKSQNQNQKSKTL